MVQATGRGTVSPGGGLSRALPLWSLIAAEVAALVVYAVLRLTGTAQTPSTATALAVGVLGALLAVSSRTGISVFGRISRRVAYVRRGMRGVQDPSTPFDVPLPDGRLIGLRWADNRLITVVRIARPVEPSVLTPEASVVSGSALTVGTIARALTQFDIQLESIDVVAHGWRTRGAAHLTAPYTTLTRTLPAVPHQDVWIVLRLNPLHCPDAVESRGGGPTGVIRTATAATRRVANHLARQGYRPAILSAHEISSLGAQLVDGMDLHSADEQWTELSVGSYHATAYAVTTPIDAALATKVWTTPSISTTTSTTLSNVRDDVFALSTVVRYATLGELLPVAPDELKRLDGRQRPALEFTLPGRRGDVGGVTRELRTLAELDTISLPDGGSGQLVGADDRGQAIAIPLFGADVRRVDVHGSMYLVTQIVARAIAVGARVLVRTDRPDEWRSIVAAVNDPMTLVVSASPTDQRHAQGTYSLCILDAREAIEDPTITTQLRVHRVAHLGGGIDEGSDVSIRQDAEAQGRITVVTRSGATPVTLVSIPEEATVVEGAQRVRATQPAAPRRPAMAAAGSTGPDQPPLASLDDLPSGGPPRRRGNFTAPASPPVDPSGPGRHSHLD